MSDGYVLPGREEDLEDGVPSDGPGLRRLAELFTRHLARYLHGFGYPGDPVYATLLDTEKRQEALLDPAFRARQFLSHMSGTAFLDMNPQNLEVSSCFPLVPKHRRLTHMSTTRFDLCGACRHSRCVLLVHQLNGGQVPPFILLKKFPTSP